MFPSSTSGKETMGETSIILGMEWIYNQHRGFIMFIWCLLDAFSLVAAGWQELGVGILSLTLSSTKMESLPSLEDETSQFGPCPWPSSAIPWYIYISPYISQSQVGRKCRTPPDLQCQSRVSPWFLNIPWESRLVCPKKGIDMGWHGDVNQPTAYIL